MRILFLSHTAKPSGAELALYATVSAIAGEDPVVLFGEPGPVQERFEASGIPTVVVELPTALANFGRLNVKFGPDLLKAITQGLSVLRDLHHVVTELRPDVIVSNSSKSHMLGFLVSLRTNVPLVSIVRDRLTTEFYSRLGVHLLRAGLRVIPNGLIQNSASTAATVPRAWRLHQIRAVIPSPVVAPSPEILTRRSPMNTGEPLRVGIAGRLSPWKGQHVVIEAFARAFAPGQAELHLLGGALFGEVEYENRLRRLADTLGVAPYVTFHGHVDDVYSQMVTWDVCVHASVIPEPFGQVVVQAMLMSLPTVATAAGGPLETITDGVDGILYPPGDVDALSGLLRRLAEDAALRVRLGAEARASAQRFLPEMVAPTFRATLYAAVLRRRGRRFRLFASVTAMARCSPYCIPVRRAAHQADRSELRGMLAWRRRRRME